MITSITIRILAGHGLITPIRSFGSKIIGSKLPCNISSYKFPQKFPRFSSISINADHLAMSKKSSTPKRGPKFRTPSKIKDSYPSAFSPDDTLDNDKRLDWNIWAYATAEEYHMDSLSQRLKQGDDYEVKLVAKDLPDVFRLIPKSKPDHGDDRREIFIFSTGSTVFWDVPHQERSEFLRNLRPFERKPLDKNLVEEECERLTYVLYDYAADMNGSTLAEKHAPDDEAGSHVIRRGKFRNEILYLDAAGRDSIAQLLERYTVSNVMSASVQLSMWETDFENLANALDDVTTAMNEGKISLHKKETLSFAGRLTKLRHNVNLHSDLLDHPDFYWERVGLEKLYDRACEILCIGRRVRVVNKKLDDAMALIQIIMQELAVRHSGKLEWLIIYLIWIEVLFDAYHCWKIS